MTFLRRRGVTGFLAVSFLAAGCKDKSAPANTDRDLAAAVRRIIQVQSCAQQSAQNSATAPDYPRTLEAMGPDGTACIDSSALGVSAGSVMRYFPAADSAGHVQHYWVMSRDAKGEPGRPVYLGDENGQVFESRYDPRWEQSGPDSTAKLLWLRTPVPYLRTVFRCIQETYWMDQGEFPEDLSRSGHREPPGRCITFPDRSSAVFEVDQGNRVGSGKFVVEYRASEKDERFGYPKSFSVSAWPVAYGEASIRSFFVDTLGAIHFTSENRRATSGDSLVFGCERRDTWWECSLREAQSRAMTGEAHH